VTSALRERRSSVPKRLGRVLVSLTVNSDQAGIPTPPSRGRGDELVWSLVGTLVAGPIAWGAIGAGVDYVVGTTRVFLPIGVVLGFTTSFLVVYLRYGRE
jgi:F0F1-type ATP synthase assembly protein I